jgi:hypothetical protein
LLKHTILFEQIASPICSNNLLKQFAQTICSNNLLKQFAQTICSNNLLKQFAQTICSNTRFYLSKSLRQHLKTQRKPNRFLSNFDLGNGLTLYDMLDLHGQMSRSPNET